MKYDITELLKNWGFDPDNNIRFIKDETGREIMQIRLPLGIEQYELNDRPDGKKPLGKKSYLEFYEEQRQKCIKQEKSFSLTNSDFKLLREEALLYYYRYIVLFQIGEYDLTISDTEHNLSICDMVKEYYKSKDASQLLQYLPYIIRINRVSKAMLFINKNLVTKAKKILLEAKNLLENMEKIDTEIFDYEKRRSINQINEILNQIKKQYPDQRELLEQELKKAIETENFKRAAQIRDKIKKLDNLYAE